MNATKKTYEAPEMEIVEIEQADIICTSGEGQPNPRGAGFEDLEDGGSVF